MTMEQQGPFLCLQNKNASLTGENSGLNGIAMFFPPLFLEPMLISYLGFTVGQYFFGIQVINADTDGKCSLVVSFLRYILKILLGGFSLVYMLFSNKHQAIHDIAANTLVILSHKKIEKNPEFIEYGDVEQNLENDQNYQYPSAVRRFIFFCIWIVVASVIFGVIVELSALMFVPDYTLDTEELPKHIDIATNVLGSMLFITIAVLASKGQLPGAKRKKNF